MTEANKRRVAVLFPGALGDFVCLIPALRALARDARVEVFAKTEFADIVPQNISVCSLERYEINRLFVAGSDIEPRVRNFFSSYERVYSWMGNGQPVFERKLRVLAPGRARLFAFRGGDPVMHQADYYLACVGASRDPTLTEGVPLRPASIRWSEKFWDTHALNGKTVLVVAPGSGAREKNWPPAYFAALARWWRRSAQGQVVVLFGPVEEDRGGFELLAEDFIAARNLSLADAAALLQRADLYVGNDSGITHLAAAVGAPTVAIFGPSSPQCWQPRGSRVVSMRLGVACSPCDVFTMKRCPHRKCLTTFLPADIIDELERPETIATLTRVGAGIKVDEVDDHVDDIFRWITFGVKTRE